MEKVEELNSIELNLSALGKNLKRIMQQKDVTMSQLHKQTKVPLPTISRLLHDTNINPTLGSLLPIAKFLNVSIDELVLEAPTYLNLEVPIFKWDEALNMFNSDYDNYKEFIKLNIPQKQFALYSGDDIANNFLKNSVLLISPEIDTRNGDYVLCSSLSNRNISIKKYLMEDGDVYLRSLTKGLNTIKKADSFEILGTITMVLKKYY